MKKQVIRRTNQVMPEQSEEQRDHHKPSQQDGCPVGCGSSSSWGTNGKGHKIYGYFLDPAFCLPA